MNYADRERALVEATPEELRQVSRLIVGRLFRMASRPSEPEDARVFEELKFLAREVSAALGEPGPVLVRTAAMVAEFGDDVWKAR